MSFEYKQGPLLIGFWPYNSGKVGSRLRKIEIYRLRMKSFFTVTCHVGGAAAELRATIESHCPLRRKAHLSMILGTGVREDRKAKETLEISIIPGCLRKSRNVGRLLVSLLVATREGSSLYEFAHKREQENGEAYVAERIKRKGSENYKVLLVLSTTRRDPTTRKQRQGLANLGGDLRGLRTVANEDSILEC